MANNNIPPGYGHPQGFPPYQSPGSGFSGFPMVMPTQQGPYHPTQASYTNNSPIMPFVPAYSAPAPPIPPPQPPYQSFQDRDHHHQAQQFQRQQQPPHHRQSQQFPPYASQIPQQSYGRPSPQMASLSNPRPVPAPQLNYQLDGSHDQPLLPRPTMHHEATSANAREFAANDLSRRPVPKSANPNRQANPVPHNHAGGQRPPASVSRQNSAPNSQSTTASRKHSNDQRSRAVGAGSNPVSHTAPDTRDYGHVSRPPTVTPKSSSIQQSHTTPATNLQIGTQQPQVDKPRQDSTSTSQKGPITHKPSGVRKSQVGTPRHDGTRKLPATGPRPSQPTVKASAAESQLSQHVSSQSPLLSGAQNLPVDYQVLLLGLADEFIAKAHGMSAVLARSNSNEADLETYHSLIATGLGCLESVLKNWKFQDPRLEARLLLKFATLLFEESDNEIEAQDLLNRGITHCERHRLLDLRYSMIHLQLRFHARTKPRSAYKMIDKLLPNVEAYKHVAWLYAFRFLRISITLQFGAHQDFSAALQHLRSISELAVKHRHIPIVVASAAIEALVHLQMGGSDSVELAQRSLAAARMHQLDPALNDIPQIGALLETLDLCCNLINYNQEQAMAKMRAMQKIMDDLSMDQRWPPDGSFVVPVGEAALPDDSLNTNGIFGTTTDGQRGLVFQWMRRSEIFALGYMLSGITTTSKNVVDRKAEQYLLQGRKITTEDYDPVNERKAQSFTAARAHLERRAHFYRLMSVHAVFAFCNRSDWAAAWKELEPLAQGLDPTAPDVTDPLDITVLYLVGVLKQANGDLPGALRYFNAPCFALDAHSKTSNAGPTQGAVHDLRVLALLNRILAQRPSSSSSDNANDSSTTQQLLAQIEPICVSHADKSFAAAYNIARTSSVPNLPIIKVKDFLSKGMVAAKAVANAQLICITMNLMTATFFTDIVGEQAEKVARVGRQLASRSKNPLWLAVSDMQLSKTLGKSGVKDEAEGMRRQALQAMTALAPGVKAQFEGPHEG